MVTRGKVPFGRVDSLVPASDGAGVVEAVGQNVTRFKAGDKVLTTFFQDHIAGPLDARSGALGIGGGLGGAVDGVLREYGAFHEQDLVHMPAHLSFHEGCTLPCAALAAWNALFGLEGRKLVKGD